MCQQRIGECGSSFESGRLADAQKNWRRSMPKQDRARAATAAAHAADENWECSSKNKLWKKSLSLWWLLGGHQKYLTRPAAFSLYVGHWFICDYLWVVQFMGQLNQKAFYAIDIYITYCVKILKISVNFSCCVVGHIDTSKKFFVTCSVHGHFVAF